MEIEDFALMSKGYWKRRERDELNFANVAFTIDAFASGLSGKRVNYKTWINQWFGKKEKPLSQEDLNKRSAEIMKRVELMNKVLAEKEKYGRAAKNNN
jgi:hypothetical protein